MIDYDKLQRALKHLDDSIGLYQTMSGTTWE